MPRIYLSPSTQEYNTYVSGGTEEYYMNLIADAMEPYLYASGIEFVRNTPQMTAASSIRQANQDGNFDFYLSLHSNAAPESDAGKYRGTDVYYYPGSINGKRAADIFADNLKAIYPLPDKVQTRTTTYLGEVTKTRFPAVLIEFAYHDNPEDAAWITNNIGTIARNVVLSLTEYFGIPFIEPQVTKNGVVNVTSGGLYLRNKPSVIADIKTTIPNGSRVKIYGSWQDWYVVEYNGQVGYASKQYIQLA